MKTGKKLMLAASMVIFGTLGPFTRQIGVSAGELALYRAVLAALLITGYLAATRQGLDLKVVKKELFLLLLSGIAMGINWVLLFQAYRFTSICAATLSYYFAPVIVTAACPLLFHERLSAKQIVCFVASTAGLVLLIGLDGLSGRGTDGRGILFGLGAALFYACVILLNKLIRGVTGIHRTLLQFLGAILVLLPYVLWDGGIRLALLDGIGWGCLLTVGLVHTGITYCMYFTALKELPGQTAAILSYIDPLVAVLLSFFVLGERMAPLQILGGVLILGFTLWNEL